MKKQVCTALSVCILLTGCASSTVIKSEPPGAKVFIEGQKIGETPLEYEDASTVFTTQRLRIAKDGYRPEEAKLTKTDVRVWPIIGALFVLVPLLWVTGYQDEFNYELEPESKPENISADESSPL